VARGKGCVSNIVIGLPGSLSLTEGEAPCIRGKKNIPLPTAILQVLFYSFLVVGLGLPVPAV
jgi:hypothetical protein